MTIDEAINENQKTLCVPNSEFLKPKYQAIALGNEALKAWQEHRRIMGHPKLWILPGETKE